MTSGPDAVTFLTFPEKKFYWERELCTVESCAAALYFSVRSSGHMKVTTMWNIENVNVESSSQEIRSHSMFSNAVEYHLRTFGARWPEYFIEFFTRIAT